MMLVVIDEKLKCDMFNLTQEDLREPVPQPEEPQREPRQRETVEIAEVGTRAEAEAQTEIGTPKTMVAVVAAQWDPVWPQDTRNRVILFPVSVGPWGAAIFAIPTQ